MSAGRGSVQTGAWINHTKGRVLGATITLDAERSVLLIAFFALFVRLIHQWRSKRGMRDAFHHQEQAMLRNSSSVTTTLWLWISVAWAWRSKTSHPILRSLALISAAILHIVAFAIAGLFSSNVARVNTAVLSSSENCGSWRREYMGWEKRPPEGWNHTTLLGQQAYAINARKEIAQAHAYARGCYYPGSDCSTYIKTALSNNKDYVVDANASCPFDGSLCVGEAVSIDTGLLDSAVDLGINAPLQDRILYRRTTSCAMLSTEDRVESEVADMQGTPWPNLNTTYFDYGRNVQENTSYTHSDDNYTTSTYTYNFAYDVKTKSSIKAFDPDPEFQAAKSDIEILFLTNKVMFYSPVDDPWFSAHREVPADEYWPVMYKADTDFSPLGCKSQHQFCDPTLPDDTACTELDNWSATFDSYEARKDTFSDLQYAALRRIIHAAYEADFFEITKAIDAEALVATESVSSKAGLGLEPDQWKSEVINLHNILLTYLQSLMVSYVRGPVIPSDIDYIDQPSSNWEFLACTNQIVNDQYYYSFSTLGIAIILAIGLLIILLNLCLVPFVRLIRKRSGNPTGAYKQLEWDLTETVQLQRLVYEGQGAGTWYGNPEQIPTTVRVDRFGIPEWTGQGEQHRRVSRDHLSFYGNEKFRSGSGSGSGYGKAESPLMKDGVASEVKEL